MNMSSQEDLKIVNAKLRAELEKDKPRISKAADYAKRAQALLRRVTDELSDEIAECDDDAARSAMQDSLDEAHQVTTQLCKRASATVEAHRQKQLQEDNRADDEHVVANTDVEVHAVSESASADTAPMQASASATDDLAKMKREMLDLKQSLSEALARTEHERDQLRKEREALSKKARNPRVSARPNIDFAVTSDSESESADSDEDDVTRDAAGPYRPARAGTSDVRRTRRYAGGLSPARSLDSRTSSMLERVCENMNAQLGLPNAKLKRFGGDPQEYAAFISVFETAVEARVTDPRTRLSYLVQQCDGDARRAIERCQLLPEGEGYRRARQTLKTLYGGKKVVARACLNTLMAVPRVKEGQHDRLQELAIEFERASTTLRRSNTRAANVISRCLRISAATESK